MSDHDTALLVLVGLLFGWNIMWKRKIERRIRKLEQKRGF